MGNIARKINRNKEKEELENIRKLYHKKPKQKCPKCKKRTLFFTNDKKEVYCIRCENMIQFR